MVVSDGLRDRCATVKRFYTAASLATRRFAAPMMADDARDRRTTRLIKGVTLSTLLSLIFAPAQECQCPTHYYNQTNRKQRRIAVLGVKHEQRRDDEAAHKQSHRINTRRFIDDHPGGDYSQRKRSTPNMRRPRSSKAWLVSNKFIVICGTNISATPTGSV